MKKFKIPRVIEHSYASAIDRLMQGIFWPMNIRPYPYDTRMLSDLSLIIFIISCRREID